MELLTEFTEPACMPRTTRETRSQAREWFVFVIMTLVCITAFSVRLFAVVRFERVIHEFDPQFNFKATQVLSERGLEGFTNWFDTGVWYPLGRWVGHTVYPGLMATAAFLHHVLNALSLRVELRDVCVFFGPVFAALTAIVTFLLTKEAFDTGAAIAAAAFIAIAPGYTSRSVAGSYDNEAVAIFALVNAFYLFVKAVNTGSLSWGAGAALGYAFMVTTWGGYIYIANLLPLYAFTMVLLGRYSDRLYIAYTTYYVLGMLLNLLIPFVGFSGVSGTTHLLGHGVFALFQLHYAVMFLRQHIGQKRTILAAKYVGGGLLAAFATLIVVANVTGLGSDGRFAFLLNPMGSKMAIVASVAEHQGSTWACFWYDFGVLLFLAPVGVYYSVAQWTDGALFLLAYYVSSVYFSSIMIRLMLVVAPVMCIMAGIAVSRTYALFLSVGQLNLTPKKVKSGERPNPQWHRVSQDLGYCVAGVTLLLCFFATVHSRWVTSEVYSSPAVIIKVSKPDGTQALYDDYREAYSWMRQNTAEDAKFMSWWDYGYQASTMANRTTIVDNNTWNNSHIATVGKCMGSSEEECAKILRRLDVDYVFVVFGGLIGYSSDDIGKFLWMVKIAGSVYPEINDRDYYGDSGRYTVGPGASKKMLNSMMYKMAYYRFSEVSTVDTASTSIVKPKEGHSEMGYDRARSTQIARGNFTLSKIEEAFTSSHWMVRIYRVLKEPNRG